MTLKSFGCSFIWGSDLPDTLDTTRKALPPSNFTYPALLAQHFGLEYACYARPGSGNLQILERILNEVPTSTSQDLFVIGWTWTDRFDYCHSTDPNLGLWVNPNNPTHKTTPWLTIMPCVENDLSHTYFQHLHSEYRDKFTCLTYAKLAIDILQQHNIPFVMNYMDELMFDQRWHTTPGVLMLQDTVKSHMTQFDNLTFLNWSRHHGFAESATWHPLEEAHSAAADYMITVFDKQKTSGPVQRVLF